MGLIPFVAALESLIDEPRSSYSSILQSDLTLSPFPSRQPRPTVHMIRLIALHKRQPLFPAVNISGRVGVSGAVKVNTSAATSHLPRLSVAGGHPSLVLPPIAPTPCSLGR